MNFHVSQGKFSCCVAKFQWGTFDVGPVSSQISALNFYLWSDSEVNFRVLQVKFSTWWRKFSGYFSRLDQQTKKFSTKFWSELENFSGEFFLCGTTELVNFSAELSNCYCAFHLGMLTCSYVYRYVVQHNKKKTVVQHCLCYVYTDDKHINKFCQISFLPMVCHLMVSSSRYLADKTLSQVSSLRIRCNYHGRQVTRVWKTSSLASCVSRRKLASYLRAKKKTSFHPKGI